MRRDLGDFLAEGGAVVGGGAALGATVGFVLGSIVHDLDAAVEPEEWARTGGFYGGILGMAALAFRGLD